MNKEKLHFLQNDLIPLLKKLKGDEKGKWGVLNAQQMVEHFAESVQMASGKLAKPQIVFGEQLESFREFLMSEKPFYENTKNPLMDEKGAPIRYPDMQSAIAALQNELNDFFKPYESDNALYVLNPFFGDLDYSGQVQLLHKHALHHLRQFGLAE